MIAKIVNIIIQELYLNQASIVVDVRWIVKIFMESPLFIEKSKLKKNGNKIHNLFPAINQEIVADR